MEQSKIIDTLETYQSSMTPSTMAPKKKSGILAHPSTSKAPPPAASNAMEDAKASEDMNAAGDVVGAPSPLPLVPLR